MITATKPKLDYRGEVAKWRKDPLEMKRKLWPHVQFYDKQIEIIESVRDNRETVVVAGNMLGKDFVSGFIALWFFICHYRFSKSDTVVRVITTSVGEKHLTVLWGEIAKFLTSSRIPLLAKDGGFLVLSTYQLRFVNEVHETGNNARNYLMGMVSGSGEGMQGKHAENTLLIIDEASGVSDEAYNMGATWAKKILAIGNPLPTNNFFKRGVTEGDLIL